MTPSGEIRSVGRNAVERVAIQQGIAGFIFLSAVTVLYRNEPVRIIDALGPSAPVLIGFFFIFAVTLQLMKFELTNLIYVSLGLTAFVAMFPLLGIVISAWTAVAAAIISRLVLLLQSPELRAPGTQRRQELLNMFRMFATYGIPVATASMLYRAIGGHAPVMVSTGPIVWRVALAGTVLIALNMLIMWQVMRAYGYSWNRVLQISIYDGSIYILGLPYSISLTLSYGSIGWGGLAALAFTGVIGNMVARNLAIARSAGRLQLQRLASLSSIGKTISLDFTTEQLSIVIYTECRKVIDTSMFAIALIDEHSNELKFELDIRDGEAMAKTRIPLGEGLNSWVVSHHAPLLLGSAREEERLGISAVEDGMTTEAWLGVPMVARDRVIGVISVQSYRKNAFTRDDVLLLTSVANQAAVALENAKLYKDLEGLTFALEQRVQERTAELREANIRLLAADRSKNQFLANMSHELRTPLNSIIGFSSVLLESSREALPLRMYKFLENIRTAGNHLLELINDILDLSKIEAGKLELRPEQFDLRETIASIERVMRGLAAENNVRIVTAIDEDVPPVRLDEGRVKQILLNLLSNAVKFSPAMSAVALNVSYVRGDASPLAVDSIRLVLADRGIGIPRDEQGRIFDHFYQTEAGRSTRKGGTGLGLSLVRSFVEMHEGKIEVDSRLGEGTTFTIHLPTMLPARARAAAAAAPAKDEQPVG